MINLNKIFTIGFPQSLYMKIGMKRVPPKGIGLYIYIYIYSTN